MPEQGLEARDIRAVLGGLVALDGVSIAVSPGEVVGVIGPNGAGKTTLFNVISGFVRPAAGSIWYRGRELHGHRPHDLAALGIARTLQGVGLWPGLTALENVMVGAHARLHTDLGSALLGLWRSSREDRALRARALERLAEMGVSGYASALPRAMPYGVQKKVALARAMVGDPVILLLDEPASGLSAGEMDELRRVIGGLRERAGVLLVEHHMDFVMAMCDRVTVLDYGRVVMSGTPDEVRGDARVVTAYLGEAVTAPAPEDVGEGSGGARVEGEIRARG